MRIIRDRILPNDMVIATVDHPSGNKVLTIGDRGRVLHIGQNTVSVEWDRYIDGHRGYNEQGKNGHCWNTHIDNVKKVQREWDI